MKILNGGCGIRGGAVPDCVILVVNSFMFKFTVMTSFLALFSLRKIALYRTSSFSLPMTPTVINVIFVG